MTMNNSFWRLWLWSQFPLLSSYALLTGLVALLCYLYRLPLIVFIDLLRFSLPLLIIWLIATILLASIGRSCLRVSCHRLIFNHTRLSRSG